jgi:thiamine-phosphate pyrophosphorylase
MMESSEAARIYLVTPAAIDPATFPRRLAEALAGGDVAAVLIAPDLIGRLAEEAAAALVPVIQAAGAAAIVAEDTRLAGRLKADGVHIGKGIGDVRMTVENARGKWTVGAGSLYSRHAAMEAGEAGADYLFFGRPHGDTHDAPHPKALELAEWWSDVMQVPAVIMAGRSLGSVAQAAATGAAFVALHEAVWLHEAGPGEAIRIASAALAGEGLRAA